MFATVTVCEKSEYRFRRFHRGVPDERVVLVIDEIKVTIPDALAPLPTELLPIAVMVC
jgi:hypothetical protein